MFGRAQQLPWRSRCRTLARVGSLLLGAALLWAPPTAADPFAPPDRYPAGDGIRALAVADVDGDGIADVLVAAPEGQLTLHPGDGAGGLGPVRVLEGPALARALDLTGDGLADLAELDASAGDLRVRARVNDGRGGFGPVLDSGAGGLPAPAGAHAFGHLDADGRTDVLAAVPAQAGGATLWAAAGRGDGTFDAWREVGASPGGRNLVLVPDVSGDGRAEAAAQDEEGRVWLSLSGPDGFGPAAVRTAAGTPGLLAAGRFAAGGGLGLAVLDPARRCVSLTPVTGEAPPAPACAATAAGVTGMAVADLDGDGLDDLVLTLADAGIQVLHGLGGTLGRPLRVAVPLSSQTSDPHVADLDRDGRPDVVAVANARELVVLRNVGRARAAVSPRRLPFAPELIGEAGDARVVTVHNRGTRALDLPAARLEGADARDFAITADGCGSARVAPSGSCRVHLRFVPRATGRREASLVLGDVTVQLSGWGLPGRA